ncbi:MAG: hypothetical protein U0350_44130 [Caldilineaceae bacterium]
MLRYKNRLLAYVKLQRVASQAEGRPYQHYADLLWRLKNGDHSAWEHFVTEWGTRVYSYLRYNTQTEDDAQHVLSEIMVMIVHEMPHFDGNITLATFVFTLAYRKVKEYWHRYGKSATLMRFASSMQEHSAKENNGVNQETALQRIWTQLEEQAQQALLLRYHAGLNINEVADVLGRSYESTEFLLNQLHRQFHHLFLGSARV